MKGTVVQIVLRPARDEAAVVVETATAVAERGLSGDRRTAKRGGDRQVTLVAEHDLVDAAALLGAPIPHEKTRRNILVRGLALTELDVGTRLLIGEVELVVRGPCDPCDRMNDALGEGARAALEGRGGVVAQIAKGGVLKKGDAIRVVAADSD